jgi:CSLREA domain-containing protein
MRAVSPPRWRKHLVLLLAVALSMSAVGPGSASADVTVHVSTIQDETVQDSQCSLREALIYASHNPEPECSSSLAGGVVTIVVPAGCYRLSSVLALSVASPVASVVISGGGAGPAGCGGGGTVIDAQENGPVLEITAFSVATLSGVTLTGGLSCSGGCEGAARAASVIRARIRRRRAAPGALVAAGAASRACRTPSPGAVG